MVTGTHLSHTLENIYEMVCESKIMCRIEVWVLNEALKDMDNGRDTELCSKWIC